MKCRNFKVFITEKGINEIDNWLQSVPVAFRARIERIIAHLEVQKDMRCSYFKALKGYSNIYEIRTIHNNIQYRPLGCYGPGENDFTLLLVATEKGDSFCPRNAPETAQKRCKLIHQDRRYIDDFV